VVDKLRLVVDDAVFSQCPRSALSINETTDGAVCGVRRTPAGIPDGQPVVAMHNCREMLVAGCLAAPGTPVFLGLSGQATDNITVLGSVLRGVARPIARGDEVPAQAVHGPADPSGL